ncbi:hypothetical protein OESDEN_13900 [Oesophagostomum dentatum]|uniref:Uncharacterized protein n=1 Tax=Oesophagostomum dentatum TaxID=61180 RepID=A0A0B1SN31_OESDE|nr:hypothetical protein OESDEN_13900 [Oesophagostomum dentatum]
MMFDTHSVQVNYVNPEEDQPDCNLIREQIAEELLEKLKEIQQTSQSGFEAAVPRLQELDAVKALSVKNMSTRALSFDDEELLHAVRLTAETEWMNVRKDVARQACTAVEQCIIDDEPDLRQLIEDTQVCEDMDEMQIEVQKLEEELSGAPSFEDAVEIFSSSERFMKEEEELDRLILAEEIEWVKLELQQARLRNAEIRQRHEWLLQQEKMLEKNAAKVRELKHEITNLRFEW